MDRVWGSLQIYLHKLYQKENTSYYGIISICHKTVNIINCAQDGAALITKQMVVKKHVYVSTSRPH